MVLRVAKMAVGMIRKPMKYPQALLVQTLDGSVGQRVLLVLLSGYGVWEGSNIALKF
jgi:hypothetical protein